jgi:hypothetical protein
VLSDISRITVPEEFYTDPDDGSKLSKDFAFCFWYNEIYLIVRACKKFGVVPIPMASFYGKEDRHLGEN